MPKYDQSRALFIRVLSREVRTGEMNIHFKRFYIICRWSEKYCSTVMSIVYILFSSKVRGSLFSSRITRLGIRIGFPVAPWHASVFLLATAIKLRVLRDICFGCQHYRTQWVNLFLRPYWLRPIGLLNQKLARVPNCQWVQRLLACLSSIL